MLRLACLWANTFVQRWVWTQSRVPNVDRWSSFSIVIFYFPTRPRHPARATFEHLVRRIWKTSDKEAKLWATWSYPHRKCVRAQTTFNPQHQSSWTAYTGIEWSSLDPFFSWSHLMIILVSVNTCRLIVCWWIKFLGSTCTALGN